MAKMTEFEIFIIFKRSIINLFRQSKLSFTTNDALNRRCELETSDPALIYSYVNNEPEIIALVGSWGHRTCDAKAIDFGQNEWKN